MGVPRVIGYNVIDMIPNSTCTKFGRIFNSSNVRYANKYPRTSYIRRTQHFIAASCPPPAPSFR